MNKEELVRALAKQSGLTKKVSEAALNAFLDVVKETITDNQKVVLVGFGSFEQKDRNERKGMNPRTKEAIVIPATKVPIFKAGKDFKARVAGKNPEPVPEAISQKEAAQTAKPKAAKSAVPSAKKKAAKK